MKEEIYTFIGKDGCGYTSHQALSEANKQWKKDNLQYMAHDGSFHSNWEDVKEVNNSGLQFKANDGRFYDDMETVRQINRQQAKRLESKPINYTLFKELDLIKPELVDTGLVRYLK
jgi:hypothetical protein